MTDTGDMNIKDSSAGEIIHSQGPPPSATSAAPGIGSPVSCFVCQICQAPLDIIGSERLLERDPAGGPLGGPSGMDQSYVVLHDGLNLGGGAGGGGVGAGPHGATPGTYGAPPWASAASGGAGMAAPPPRNQAGVSTAYPPSTNPGGARGPSGGAYFPSGAGGPGQAGTGVGGHPGVGFGAGRPMDESFVVIPSSASIYQHQRSEWRAPGDARDPLGVGRGGAGGATPYGAVSSAAGVAGKPPGLAGTGGGAPGLQPQLAWEAPPVSSPWGAPLSQQQQQLQQQGQPRPPAPGWSSQPPASAPSRPQQALPPQHGASRLRADDNGPGGFPVRNLGGAGGDGTYVSTMAPLMEGKGSREAGLSDGAGIGDGIDAHMESLARVFSLATLETGVEHPLCVQCSDHLADELAREVDEVEREEAEYRACLEELRRMGAETADEAAGTGDYVRELEQVVEEERRLEAQLASVEAERGALEAQLLEVKEQSRELAEVEQSYWHDFNNFKLELLAHQEERDAVLHKIATSSAQLEELRHVNVYNDAFHIWHQGDFGTINGFRLGRLPGINVEWEELNTAWGQACQLLHTMAHACNLTFQSARLIPLGSFPRVADPKKNIYDLYGPVHILWRSRYDKAMVLFLQCLNEFAAYATAQDKAKHPPPEKCFELPYRIDGDKVHGLTIRLSFNRDERWTKALKFTLCNLKWMLVWFTSNHGN
eukprot:jgi/Mesvir1/27142/Mv20811-RA.1